MTTEISIEVARRIGASLRRASRYGEIVANYDTLHSLPVAPSVGA